MALTERRVKRQIDQVLRLDKQSVIPNVGGMAAYGERFEIQRDYYQSLGVEDRRAYEAAVMEMSRSADVEHARLALRICHELADLFPRDWRSRVKDLVQELVDDGLPLAYHGAISDEVILLIGAFHLESLIPLVREYLHDLVSQFKEGGVNHIEFKTLLHSISRVLITDSPSDFWIEFTSLSQDRDLLGSLDKDVFEMMQFWAYTGIEPYGLNWLREIAIRSVEIPEVRARRTAYRAISDTATYLASVSGKRREVERFLNWLNETFDSHAD